MLYYNPETKEEHSYSALCLKYAASFPIDAKCIKGTWFAIKETEAPPPEDGFRFERGGVELKDGEYQRIWNRISLSPDELQAEAYTQAVAMLSHMAARKQAQTEALSSSEFALLATAGLFEEWQPGTSYASGYRLVHNGIVYEVQQDVTSLENQPPSTEGMLAIYRPLSVDPETGEEPDGSMEHPFDFTYGMDVTNGSYYRYEGKLWLAKADMPACVWVPGTAGMWQWEEVMNE